MVLDPVAIVGRRFKNEIPSRQTQKLKRALGFCDLILFYVVSGLSLRWIAKAAATGPSAIAVWFTALWGFFLPLAACALDLSSRYPAEGGLYIWTYEAFGPFRAFMSAWTYWMSNLPYFPAILFFAASSLLYLGGPMQRVADSPLYFLAFTVVMLALITLLNVVGLNKGKWLNNLGAVGILIPALILVALGISSFLRFGSATHFTVGAMMPRPGMKNFIFLSTVFFAFGGCESLRSWAKRFASRAAFISTACTIVLSLFPAEDDAHPALTLFKVVIMTLVLLTAGVAIYRSSRSAAQFDSAAQ
jgi:glutamate:GABA antiporter